MRTLVPSQAAKCLSKHACCGVAGEKPHWQPGRYEYASCCSSMQDEENQILSKRTFQLKIRCKTLDTLAKASVWKNFNLQASTDKHLWLLSNVCWQQGNDTELLESFGGWQPCGTWFVSAKKLRLSSRVLSIGNTFGEQAKQELKRFQCFFCLHSGKVDAWFALEGEGGASRSAGVTQGNRRVAA